MNKVSTLALAGLVAVTATTNASMARKNGFGDIGAAFIADVQDIWTLPGVVTNYKDALYSELGGGSYSQNVWGGAHFTLGPGVLAVWGNRPYNEGGFYGEFVPGSFGFNDPQDNIDLVYGWALSEETTLAVGLNRAASFEEQKEKNPGTDYVDTFTSNDLGLTLGLEQKNVGPIALLEVGLQYNMFGNSATYKETLPSTVDQKRTISGTDLDLRVGGDMVGEDGAFSRVELGLNMDSASGKIEDANPVPAPGYLESKFSGFGYNLGYAAGKSSDKGLGLVGIMLSSRSDVQEGVNEDGIGFNHKRAYSMFKLTGGFAAESKVNNWLTIRGGLTHNLLHSTTRERTNNTGGVADVATDSESFYGSWFDLYGGQPAEASFGFSATVGSVTFDAELDQDLLWNGPYLLTGSGSGALSTDLSATWVY